MKKEFLDASTDALTDKIGQMINYEHVGVSRAELYSLLLRFKEQTKAECEKERVATIERLSMVHKVLEEPAPSDVCDCKHHKTEHIRYGCACRQCGCRKFQRYWQQQKR